LSIVVREVRSEEFDRLGALTLAAYLELPATHGDEEYIDELRDVAARAAVVPVLVAVDAATGQLLGGVTYVPGPGPFAEQEEADEAGFRMLAVDPAAQGRGVGRALVQACVDRARADGKRRIVLLTRPDMTTAHRLYERLGFGREPANDWEYEPGRWLWGYSFRL
jgi:ribosomal protein S18 acetylase RimI-like enzyme